MALEVTIEEFVELLRLTEKERVSVVPLSGFANTLEVHYVEKMRLLIEYGNNISRTLQKLDPKPPFALQFCDSGNIKLAGHPKRTDAKPDIVVLRKREEGVEADPHWSELESVSEVRTVGTSFNDQALTYTALILQARPDLVVALTFHVDDNGITLLATDVGGCRYSQLLQWASNDLPYLFGAFVYRLHWPHSSMIDRSVRRAKSGEPGLFNVDLWDDHNNDDSTYEIAYVGHVFGSRNTIFKNVRNPVSCDNIPAIFVKDQYTVERRFNEYEVLHHVHQQESVPGVVKVLRHFEPLKRGIYTKTRLAEGDMGRRLISARTPRELLIGIYDLLEVTRYLFSEKKVLHRDISRGNVFLNPNPGRSSIPSSKICCANYLLHKTDHPSEVSTALIDFNLAEITDQKSGKTLVDRTGTPIFIARGVAAGKALQKRPWVLIFPPMPPVPSTPRYSVDLKERVSNFTPQKRFFQDGDEWFKSKTPDLWPEWRHNLHHEAESAFWLLFYWIILAFPQTSSSLPVIPNVIWTKLVNHWGDVADERDTIINNFDETPTVFHPGYSKLMPLVEELWSHISSDHYWVLEGQLSEPDYVHEAFQRIILTFLLSDNPVLDVEKDPNNNRQVEKIVASRTEKVSDADSKHLTTSSRKRRGSGESSQQSKKHKSRSSQSTATALMTHFEGLDE